VRSTEMLTEILKHEQGHYNIAYLEQQELLRTVGMTVFYDDYLYKAKDILRRVDAKYKQLNVDYDEDTNHMLNREQQRNWDAYFRKQLEFLPPQPERLTNNFSR
jgi:predicted secreted Zn-dependent protease